MGFREFCAFDTLQRNINVDILKLNDHSTKKVGISVTIENRILCDFNGLFLIVFDVN